MRPGTWFALLIQLPEPSGGGQAKAPLPPLLVTEIQNVVDTDAQGLPVRDPGGYTIMTTQIVVNVTQP